MIVIAVESIGAKNPFIVNRIIFITYLVYFNKLMYNGEIVIETRI
jgi:hypothetical protein